MSAAKRLLNPAEKGMLIFWGLSPSVKVNFISSKLISYLH